MKDTVNELITPEPDQKNLSLRKHGRGGGPFDRECQLVSAQKPTNDPSSDQL